MRLVTDWKSRSIGVSHSGWVYYVAWLHPDVRFCGVQNDEDYAFIGPSWRLGLWFISFIKHLDRTEYI